MTKIQNICPQLILKCSEEKNNELTISKLTLGTAQLGMKYGIANKKGKPRLKDSFKILDYALNHGITTFDTASTYGDSEKIIGSYLHHKRKPIIVTKIPHIICKKQKPTLDDVYEIVKNLIKNSCERLCLKKIPICLMHDPSDMIKYDGLVEKALLSLKNQKIISKVGISAYTPDDVSKFLENKNLDVIQIPINILDTRLIKNGLLHELKNEGKDIFARSIFLQGLLLLEESEIPKKLTAVLKPLKKIKKICLENNLETEQLAFLFVRDLKEIISMVIGVETLDQLKRNMSMLGYPSLSEQVVNQILKIGYVPEKILNPSKWC